MNAKDILLNIDAGHGSNTAGKRTPDGYKEHYANVKCAKFFEDAAKRCGFRTMRTGWNDANATDDADTSLLTRQKAIKANGADASISFHFNAFQSTWNAAQGIETLIHSIASYRGDSERLAACIQKQLIKGTAQKNRGVKLQELAMCNCRVMGTKAAVLIEAGFMTNEYEAKLMKSDAFCKETAEEVAQGVCDYYGVAYVQPSQSQKPAQPAPSGELYRVRKSWSNAASQIGAYKSLDNAKKACIKGYTVYNAAGKAVYTNAPVNTTAYYAKYTGKSSSLDEIFKAIGVPEKFRGSWNKRKPVADKNGIANYKGTATQNGQLKNLARSGNLKKV